MNRAGPLRYWSLTILAALVVLAALAAVAWGTYELFQTGTCGDGIAPACPSDTALHIAAVVVGPLAAGAGLILFALRGGTARPSRLLRVFRRREHRVADMVARGEMTAPPVARPSAPPDPPAPWPPATWNADFLTRPQPSGSPIERLQRLRELKDEGLITVAEFEAHKKRIVGGV